MNEYDIGESRCHERKERHHMLFGATAYLPSLLHRCERWGKNYSSINAYCFHSLAVKDET